MDRKCETWEAIGCQLLDPAPRGMILVTAILGVSLLH